MRMQLYKNYIAKMVKQWWQIGALVFAFLSHVAVRLYPDKVPFSVSLGVDFFVLSIVNYQVWQSVHDDFESASMEKVDEGFVDYLFQVIETSILWLYLVFGAYSYVSGVPSTNIFVWMVGISYCAALFVVWGRLEEVFLRAEVSPNSIKDEAGGRHYECVRCSGMKLRTIRQAGDKEGLAVCPACGKTYTLPPTFLYIK